jgi:pimeloyl-ACP methyl ester carboxylesterase
LGTSPDISISVTSFFAELDDFSPTPTVGEHRWTGAIAAGRTLEAFGLNQGSDVLVVSLHGATDRKKYVLPRFERLATLRETPYSSLYFGDPTLLMSQELELGWYAGWRGFNGHYWIAEWTRRVAKAFGCTKIIFCGSSGGGMASMQAATFVPDSLALAFNPQTDIFKYKVDGERDHPQRRFCQGVFPDLVPQGWAARDESVDWTLPLGDLTSAVKKYESPRANYVMYVQNRNDFFHVRDQLLPFRDAVERTLSAKQLTNRFRFEEYDGPIGHVVPNKQTYTEYLDRAVAWLHTSPHS